MLAWLAEAFLKAFGDTLLDWLAQKRAEAAQRDLGAARERERQKDATIDNLDKAGRARVALDDPGSGRRQRVRDAFTRPDQ